MLGMRPLAVIIVAVCIGGPAAAADADRPDNIRPWAAPAPRAGASDARRADIERARAVSQARRAAHGAAQYRSDLAGTRFRLERENRADRRSFDRLQRLRREEHRLRR